MQKSSSSESLSQSTGASYEATIDKLVEMYSYEKIRGLGKASTIGEHYYMLYPLNDGGQPMPFIGFEAIEDHPRYEKTHNTRPNKAGWKFHISLADNDQANLAKGWDITLKSLIKHGVVSAKVVKPDYILAEHGAHERGKQITIFAYRDTKSPAQWKIILEEINTELAQENVLPGPRPPATTNRPLAGSNYITYRNDSNPKGHYISERKAKTHNESGKKDPYQNMQLDEIEQPPIPDFSSASEQSITDTLSSTEAAESDEEAASSKRSSGCGPCRPM